MNKLESEAISIGELEVKAAKILAKKRDTTARRFPLAFGGAASFGLVSTYYGFERIIDSIDFFDDKPWALLAMGITVLVATGTAYRKLN